MGTFTMRSPLVNGLMAAVFGAVLVLWPAIASPQQEPNTAPDANTESAAPAPGERKAFRGSITVEDSPIVEGSKIDVSGSLVTSISEQQIEDMYAQDLTSALRRVPGVVMSRYNPVGAFGGGDGGAFFIRGHGSGRPGGEIEFLTDGIPRFVGIWSHPLIDVANLDSTHRIDVYRSAQPVLLGNMAFHPARSRRSLYGLLRHLRHPGRELRVWGSFRVLRLLRDGGTPPERRPSCQRRRRGDLCIGACGVRLR